MVFWRQGSNFFVSKRSVSSRHIWDVGTTTLTTGPVAGRTTQTATVLFGAGQNSPTLLTPALSTRKAYSAESSSHSAVAVDSKADGRFTLFHCCQILSEFGG